MSSLLIIDKFLWSVLSVSPGSDSAGALVSWFCDNLHRNVYKLAKLHLRAKTKYKQMFGNYQPQNNENRFFFNFNLF